MTTTFDTLAFVRKLEAAGIDRDKAEAHADAVRDCAMSEVATKRDLEALTLTIGRQLSDLEMRLVIRIGAIVVASAGILGYILKSH